MEFKIGNAVGQVKYNCRHFFERALVNLRPLEEGFAISHESDKKAGR